MAPTVPSLLETESSPRYPAAWSGIRGITNTTLMSPYSWPKSVGYRAGSLNPARSSEPPAVTRPGINSDPRRGNCRGGAGRRLSGRRPQQALGHSPDGISFILDLGWRRLDVSLGRTGLWPSSTPRRTFGCATAHQAPKGDGPPTVSSRIPWSGVWLRFWGGHQSSCTCRKLTGLRRGHVDTDISNSHKVYYGIFYIIIVSATCS